MSVDGDAARLSRVKAWNEEPEPSVGAPDADTILEHAGGTVWLWKNTNDNAIIEYSGEPVRVTR